MINIVVPSPGESITEVEIASWNVEDGAYVERDAELATINSDKATLVVAAESAGIVKIVAKAGDVVKVGSVIATIDETAAKTSSKPAEEKKELVKQAVVETPASKEKTYAEGVASPSAEKLMKEKGLANVEGSGRGGRVTKTDVILAMEKGAAETASKTPASNGSGNGASTAAAPKGERNERRQKMTTLRRKIAQRLVSVKNETAMLTTFNEVDMYEIMQLRNKYKDKFKERYGVGLGFMSFFTKACSEALKQFPNVNGQISGEEIVHHDYVDMGIAVSTERGLVVPVIRNAEKLSLAEIEIAIRDYATKARDGKLSLEEMTGGTFTITNGGVFGSMLSTPIINPPQSAILGMHNIVERPVAINGEVKIRPIMYVALSYDHRIIDGKDSVSFLYKVKEYLEDPARLLVGI
jgi:2-oxoglutarate dehydrogenase E2 component (dihydrolipoamide succinyltransferase)